MTTLTKGHVEFITLEQKCKTLEDGRTEHCLNPRKYNFTGFLSVTYIVNQFKMNKLEELVFQLHRPRHRKAVVNEIPLPSNNRKRLVNALKKHVSDLFGLLLQILLIGDALTLIFIY